MEPAEIAERWEASGCAALTAPAVAAPATLVRGVTALVAALDARGAGLADEFPGGGLGVLAQRARLLGLARSGRVSCGGASRLVPTTDGELVVSLARASDAELLPAWAGLAGAKLPEADVWDQVDSLAAQLPAAALAAAAAELGLAAAVVGEVTDGRAAVLHRLGDALPRPLTGTRVVNLGSLWAAPLAAHLLARMGADVVAVESSTRPDGARATPAFFDAMRRGVGGATVDLSQPEELAGVLAEADVVIDGSRPRALRQLGLDAELLTRTGPRVWLSITGHGRDEPYANRIGFGDDAAAAGGLVGRVDGRPMFLADAVADPLTGLTTAAAAADLLERGGRWIADIALSRVAAALADHCPPSEHRS